MCSANTSIRPSLGSSPTSSLCGAVPRASTETCARLGKVLPSQSYHPSATLPRNVSVALASTAARTDTAAPRPGQQTWHQVSLSPLKCSGSRVSAACTVPSTSPLATQLLCSLHPSPFSVAFPQIRGQSETLTIV